MNEFKLIEKYFTNLTDNNIILDIGDDAACIDISKHKKLLVSTDTLVDGVHFDDTWNAFDIAYKAIMVNVSDIIATGGKPAFITLALSLPKIDESWLDEFAKGIKNAAGKYRLSLIGGDTTRGSLTITVTILGFVDKAVSRSGAKIGDVILLSDKLGAGLLALEDKKLTLIPGYPENDRNLLLNKLYRPTPDLKLADYIQKYANSAIDISDGLVADLGHILEKSNVGAEIIENNIPVHPMVTKYNRNKLDYALYSGDEYSLCFTVKNEHKHLFIDKLNCVEIGTITDTKNFTLKCKNGTIKNILTKGYQHF